MNNVNNVSSAGSWWRFLLFGGKTGGITGCSGGGGGGEREGEVTPTPTPEEETTDLAEYYAQAGSPYWSVYTDPNTNDVLNVEFNDVDVIAGKYSVEFSGQEDTQDEENDTYVGTGYVYYGAGVPKDVYLEIHFKPQLETGGQGVTLTIEDKDDTNGNGSIDDNDGSDKFLWPWDGKPLALEEIGKTNAWRGISIPLEQFTLSSYEVQNGDRVFNPDHSTGIGTVSVGASTRENGGNLNFKIDRFYFTAKNISSLQVAPADGETIYSGPVNFDWNSIEATNPSYELVLDLPNGTQKTFTAGTATNYSVDANTWSELPAGEIYWKVESADNYGNPTVSYQRYKLVNGVSESIINGFEDLADFWTYNDTGDDFSISLNTDRRAGNYSLEIQGVDFGNTASYIGGTGFYVGYSLYSDNLMLAFKPLEKGILEITLEARKAEDPSQILNTYSYNIPVTWSTTSGESINGWFYTTVPLSAFKDSTVGEDASVLVGDKNKILGGVNFVLNAPEKYGAADILVDDMRISSTVLSPVLISPEAKAAFGEEDVNFSWEKVPNATSYILLLTLESGREISYETALTSYTIPEEEWASFCAGDFTWRVIAQDQNNNPLGISSEARAVTSLVPRPIDEPCED